VKRSLFWDTPSSSLFGGTLLPSSGSKKAKEETREKQAASGASIFSYFCCLLLSDFFRDLLFDPQYGDSMPGDELFLNLLWFLNMNFPFVVARFGRALVTVRDGNTPEICKM
jgi:hypothetical protein